MVAGTVSKAGRPDSLEMGLCNLGHVTEVLSGPFLSVSKGLDFSLTSLLAQTFRGSGLPSSV